VKTKLKPIHGVLLLAILGIWGAVALQIADAVKGEEPLIGTGSVMRRTGAIEAGGVSFLANLRDPFKWGSARKDTVSRQLPRRSNPAPVWQPPPMRLMGPSGRTALIELSDGSTSFLQPHDELEGMKVLRIEAKELFFSFRGMNGSLKVE
jgi:hypothetical protein